MHLKETQDPNTSGSQPTYLPFQQSTPLDPPSSKQDQEIQDVCREILMVRISEVCEPEDEPTERLNLDDYNSDDFDEYLSDNMETTHPMITEVQATIKQDPSAPPPAVQSLCNWKSNIQQKIFTSVAACLTRRGHSGASASPTASKNSRVTTTTTPIATSAT